MLSRKAIRETFEEHPGAITRIAKNLGVTKGHVSRWLSGERDSKRIHEACDAEAKRLLKGESR